MPDDQSRSSQFGYLMAIGQVGIEMVVPIGLGVLADVKLKTMPLFVVIGVLVGLIGGMLHMMALLKRMDQLKNKKPPQTPS